MNGEWKAMLNRNTVHEIKVRKFMSINRGVCMCRHRSSGVLRP